MTYGIKHEETVPTCPDCLCKLEEIRNEDNEIRYRHFNENIFTGRDARGCRCRTIGRDFMLVNSQVTTIWSAYRVASPWKS